MYPKPSTSHHSAAIIVPWRKHAGKPLLSIDNGGDRAYIEIYRPCLAPARSSDCQVGSDRVSRKPPAQIPAKPPEGIVTSMRLRYDRDLLP